MNPITDAFLVELARLLGLELQAECRAVLRPQLESLLGRLGELGRALPRETTPLPTALERPAHPPGASTAAPPSPGTWPPAR